MKIALVTGGSKGLGETISQVLSKSGYRVYSVSRKPEKRSKKIVTKSVDISKEAQCQSLINYINKHEGRLDLLVNNAGINDKTNIEKTFGVNVFGPFYLMLNALSLLKKSRGRIINITSLNGLVPTPESSVYASSKHAIEGLGIALSYEFLKEGVNITNIAPGAIHNPQSKALTHMTLRDKFPILKKLFPVITREIVASEVIRIAKMTNPPRRVIVGNDTKVAYFSSRIFPNLWFNILQSLYKK